MTGRERQASVKIEPTPEMIEAGLEEFLNHDDGWSKPSITVRRIYLAMERARRHERLKS